MIRTFRLQIGSQTIRLKIIPMKILQLKIVALLGLASSACDSEKPQVPKWVTTTLLAINRLLQVDQKLNSELAKQLKKDDVSSQQTTTTIDDNKQNKLQDTPGLSPKHVDMHKQKRLIKIVCICIKNQLPSETMLVVLQLCSTLTKTHSIIVNFLDVGGLPVPPYLPTSNLFSGFHNGAATII